MITFIWVTLAVLTIWYSVVFIQDFLKHKKNLEPVSWLKAGLNSPNKQKTGFCRVRSMLPIHFLF